MSSRLANCLNCGKEFEPTPLCYGGSVKFCSKKCSAEHTAELDRLRIPIKKRKIYTKDSVELREMARKASEMNMSYGKYVQMLERGDLHD